jgi:hypothetical protein
VGAGVREATAEATSPAEDPLLSSVGALVVSGAGAALVKLGAAVVVADGAGVSVPQADTSMANNIHASRITLTTLLLILFVSELFIVTSSGLLVLCQELNINMSLRGASIRSMPSIRSLYTSLHFAKHTKYANEQTCKHLFFRCQLTFFEPLM